MHISPGYRRLQLCLESDLAGMSKSLNGAVKRTRNSAEGVVRIRRCAVQADGHTRDTDTIELVDRLVGQKRRGAGTHIRPQAQGHAVTHQIEEVWSLQRIASRKHH